MNSLRYDGRTYKNFRKLTVTDYPLLHGKGGTFFQVGNTQVLAVVTEKLADKSSFSCTFQVAPFASNQVFSKGTIQKNTALLQTIFEKIVSLTENENKTVQLHFTLLQKGGSDLAACFNSGMLALLKSAPYTTSFSLKEKLAACSSGILENNQSVIDLDSEEEKMAKVTFLTILNEAGEFLHLEGNQQAGPFESGDLNSLVLLGKIGCEEFLSNYEDFLTKTVAEKTQETIVIATKNKGKAKEFAALFQPLGFQVKTLLDYPELPEIPETGKTFEENAILKAEGIAKLLNQMVLADDSGLMVAALDNLPGIYSARFAGPEKSDAANNAKLLASMFDVPKEKRTAEFYCALAVAAPNKKTFTVYGTLKGEIATIPSGDNGFGYDTLFYVPTLKKTLGELTDGEKNKISHRHNALEALKKQWPIWWQEGSQNENHRRQ